MKTHNSEYTVKKLFAIFPSPTGTSRTKLPGPRIITLFPARESFDTSNMPAGDGKSLTFFYSVQS